MVVEGTMAVQGYYFFVSVRLFEYEISSSQLNLENKIGNPEISHLYLKPQSKVAHANT